MEASNHLPESVFEYALQKLTRKNAFSPQLLKQIADNCVDPRGRNGNRRKKSRIFPFRNQVAFLGLLDAVMHPRTQYGTCYGIGIFLTRFLLWLLCSVTKIAYSPSRLLEVIMLAECNKDNDAEMLHWQY